MPLKVRLSLESHKPYVPVHGRQIPVLKVRLPIPGIAEGYLLWGWGAESVFKAGAVALQPDSLLNQSF